MDDGPSSMKLWESEFFFIDRRAIPDYLTWRSTKSCVLDDFPTDGYDQNDVVRLYTRLAKLRDVDEAMLVQSGRSSVWLNQKRDPVFRRKDNNFVMSIYKFMTLPSWDDAKVVEEPHGFADSILQRVENHATTPVAEGTPILKPTPKEIIASQPNTKLAKKSKAPVNAPSAEHDDDAEDIDQGNDLSETDYCAYLEGNLERDEGNSSRAAFVLNLRSAKLDSPPPRLSNTAPFDPGYVGTSNVANASSSDHPMDLLAQSVIARDREYDNILDDDFSSATLSERIELALFPLAPRPYYMHYPFVEGESSSPPKYNREEWDEPRCYISFRHDKIKKRYKENEATNLWKNKENAPEND
ncbi:hypothetical protein Tco_0625610 [Tanacetum coccineum]|uniref:Uncharacterized protein n=1 Tax=Tanacetum coccineum TaxID=301880 RepID=A0ABQ4WHA9_9ASTR